MAEAFKILYVSYIADGLQQPEDAAKFNNCTRNYDTTATQRIFSCCPENIGYGYYNNIRELIIDACRIDKIHCMPLKIASFYCDNNNITDIGRIPYSIKRLSAKNNKLQHININNDACKHDKLTCLMLDGNNINTVPYIYNIGDIYKFSFIHNDIRYVDKRNYYTRNYNTFKLCVQNDKVAIGNNPICFSISYHLLMEKMETTEITET